MNKIVIYTSKTGFTKTYAQWIATGMDRTDKELIKPLLEEVANDK